MNTSPIIVALFVVALMTIIVTMVRLMQGHQEVWALVIFFGGWFLMTIGFAMQAGFTEDAKEKTYESNATKLVKNLSEDGFQVVSGTPDLHPDTKSLLVLSYEGENYDCTLYSPKHSNQRLWFSCGEDNRDLEQIKESK